MRKDAQHERSCTKQANPFLRYLQGADDYVTQTDVDKENDDVVTLKNNNHLRKGGISWLG